MEMIPTRTSVPSRSPNFTPSAAIMLLSRNAPPKPPNTKKHTIGIVIAIAIAIAIPSLEERERCTRRRAGSEVRVLFATEYFAARLIGFSAKHSRNR